MKTDGPRGLQSHSQGGAVASSKDSQPYDSGKEAPRTGPSSSALDSDIQRLVEPAGKLDERDQAVLISLAESLLSRRDWEPHREYQGEGWPVESRAMGEAADIVGFWGVILGAFITASIQLVAARRERRARYVDSLRLAYAAWASDFKTALAREGDTEATATRAKTPGYPDPFGTIERHKQRVEEAASAIGRSQYVLLLLEECPRQRASILELTNELLALPLDVDGVDLSRRLNLSSRLDRFLLDLIDREVLFPERKL